MLRISGREPSARAESVSCTCVRKPSAQATALETLASRALPSAKRPTEFVQTRRSPPVSASKAAPPVLSPPHEAKPAPAQAAAASNAWTCTTFSAATAPTSGKTARQTSERRGLIGDFTE